MTLKKLVEKHSRAIHWTLLIVLTLTEVIHLYWAYRPGNIPWDTQYNYLVTAQNLLNQGWAFWTTEESLRYPPLTYLCYIPFLNNLEVLRWINNLLALSSLWFIYQIIRQFSTSWHALMGLFIYVSIPGLSEYWGQLLTEPLFLFLTLVWLWATVKAIKNEKKRYLVIAIVALTLAMLTRATYTYFLYFIIVLGFIGLMNKKAYSHSGVIKRILLICIGSLIFLWLFMFKNWIYFDSFTIANGMSAALYQGLHPFLGGIAPPVYGNTYDINSITADHLSLLAEKRNLIASKILIAERSISEHFSFFLSKFYLIFFDYQNTLSRYWRLALLPFFGYVLWLSRPGKKQTLAGFIFFIMGLFLIYQFAILLPILALDRYTIAGTAIPLAVCGGYAYVSTWRRAETKMLMGLHLIALILLLIGYIDTRQYKHYWPRINPKAFIEAPTLTHQQLKEDETDEVIIEGNHIIIKKEVAHVFIALQAISSQGNNALLLLDLNVIKGGCSGKQFLETYADQNFNNPLLKRRFRLRKGVNQIRLGFFAQPRQTQLGIGLLLHCKKGTQIEYQGLQGYYDLTPAYLRQKIKTK